MREVANEEGYAVWPTSEVTEEGTEKYVWPKGVEDATMFGEKSDYFSDKTTPLVDFTVRFVDVGEDTAKEDEKGDDECISLLCEWT